MIILLIDGACLLFLGSARQPQPLNLKSDRQIKKWVVYENPKQGAKDGSSLALPAIYNTVGVMRRASSLLI
jgi:hypothetical protein